MTTNFPTTHFSSTHYPHRHESHGNHPMSFVGFVLVLAGFVTAALWLVHMAAAAAAARQPRTASRRRSPSAAR